MTPLAQAQHLLRQRFTLLLAGTPEDIRGDVLQVMQSRGKLFSDIFVGEGGPSFDLAAGVWPLLTFFLAEHLSSDVDLDIASSVAVAVESMVCAFDVFDDIVDGDQTPAMRALGKERAQISAVVLSSLATQAILALQQYPKVSPDLVIRLLDILQQGVQRVISGQQQDLLAELRPVEDFTQDECLEIIKAKSGSLMQLAFVLGAVCVEADQRVCEQVAELGMLLGIAHQLDNDCHDLYDQLQDAISPAVATGEASQRSMKYDLERGKKTLPIVLAAKAVDVATFQKKVLQDDQGKEDYLRALHEGVIKAWGICLIYQERFRDRLRVFEAQTRPLSPTLAYLLSQANEGKQERENP